MYHIIHYLLQYRAWSTPDAVNQTLTALDVGTKTIFNYEQYFGIDFPLPKQGEPLANSVIQDIFRGNLFSRITIKYIIF